MDVTDLICDRSIDIANIVASVEHKEWVYSFSSNECRAAFNVEPTRHELQLSLGQAADASGRAYG